MKDLEQDLRNALQRREPPPGFASRVSARLPERRVWPRWLALAATILIVIAGWSMWQVREREKRIAAERARSEFVKALQITASTLETTKMLLHRQTEGRTI